MNISNVSSSPPATPVSTSDISEVVDILVQKKAIDVEAGAAIMLLQALPEIRSLPNNGPLGTQVNTFV
jgi:hypothetical protein